ncbi:hypothetical protein Dda_6931 [Drechslerella dactyloides]|uniref:Prion-inhibition and propagation HeLo domain-containing protein n=1 Tax=Drechslerella dactyloides TaxID=74499 RepID=A0AAD6IU08_DREDA|nr:hypothetical protein Dda_6931 [Drechslerella dactyloides]
MPSTTFGRHSIALSIPTAAQVRQSAKGSRGIAANSELQQAIKQRVNERPGGRKQLSKARVLADVDIVAAIERANERATKPVTRSQARAAAAAAATGSDDDSSVPASPTVLLSPDPHRDRNFLGGEVTRPRKQASSSKFKYAFMDKAKFESLIGDPKAFNNGLYNLLELRRYKAVN